MGRRLLAEIGDARAALDGLLASDGFIDPQSVEDVRAAHSAAYAEASAKADGILFRLGLVRPSTRDAVRNFLLAYGSAPSDASRRNDVLASELAEAESATLNPVAGRTLDRGQLEAIVRDVSTKLVIAGAGTGKTLMLVGAVKHLLSKGARPESILLLSYTRAAVAELRGRVEAETGARCQASTLHRLGLGIISEVEGKVPRIEDADLAAFSAEAMRGMLSDPAYRAAVLDCALRISDCASEFDEAQARYLRESRLHTLGGERVKSFGEADIADWLYTHGIAYTYEEPYPVDTRDREHGQYRPDFHLDGTDVYIEYFGVDRAGGVAPFIDGGADAYRAGMEWKRALHRRCGTELVELHAYDRSEGALQEMLDRETARLGVPRGAPPQVSPFQVGGGRAMEVLSHQMASAVALLRGSGGGWASYPKGSTRRERAELERFARALRPVYEEYEGMLARKGAIDFSDMLNRASGYVDRGLYRHGFEHVLVDEFQDLTGAEAGLLRSLRRSGRYSLLCVGDDWQSIFGFRGADVGGILRFRDRFGPADVCTLGRTYRFSGTLLEASSRFMNGSPRQVAKSLAGDPGRETALKRLAGADLRGAVAAMESVLDRLDVGCRVLMLGRYNRDVLRLEQGRFAWRERVGSRGVDVTYFGRPELKIEYRTIHSAKGLEADRVFILNNDRGPGGFPAFRPECAAVRLLLGGDAAQADEERRLMYVAVTRARSAAYLLTIRGRESEFVAELLPAGRRRPIPITGARRCAGDARIRCAHGGGSVEVQRGGGGAGAGRPAGGAPEGVRPARRRAHAHGVARLRGRRHGRRDLAH